MITKILGLLNPKLPTFRQLKVSDLPSRLNGYINNKIYYTPRIQKLNYSNELSKYMKFMSRKSEVNAKDMKQLVQNILIDYGAVHHPDESINFKLIDQKLVDQKSQRIPKFGVIKNFHIKNNPSCSYNGEVDWLVYTDQLHFFPLMFFDSTFNLAAGLAMAYSNMITKLELSRNHNIDRNKDNEVEGISMITNGHEWQIIKCTQSLVVEKSIVFQAVATPSNNFQNIYCDGEMVAVSMGLIHFCLGIKDQKYLALEKVYQYLDQQKYMIQDQIEKQSLSTKLIIRLQKWNK